MTKKQEDQLSMWTATDAVLTEHAAVWGKLIAFANAVALFRKIRNEVSPEASTQQQNHTGVTYAKTILRSELVALCSQMALNIKSYAVNMKDFDLEMKFNFTPTYFEKLRDNTVPIVGDAVYEKAFELQSALGDYGVGEEEMEELNAALTKYKEMNAAPRLIKGVVKRATVNISDKIAEATVQLNQMDNLVGNFNKKFPDFVAAFRNARMVITLGVHKKKAAPPSKQPPVKPEES